jgi:YesN/AraC family two-component response regulator
MAFSNIQPFTRYVQELVVTQGEYPVFTKSYDCRLFYVSKNSGVMYFENKAYSLKYGDLVLWQPGIGYHMDAASDQKLHFLAVNFDYTQNNRDKDYPIPPDKSTAYMEDRILERIDFSDLPNFNSAVYLRGMQSVEDLLYEMKREYLTKKVYYRVRLSGLLQSVLAEIARRIASCSFEDEGAERKIDQVIAYIHSHYAEELTNAEIGGLFNYHPNYLNKQMVLFTEKSLHQYLLTYRITKAIELIESTSMPISEVAASVGFRDFCHFSKLFKKKTGSSPNSYRRIRNKV